MSKYTYSSAVVQKRRLFQVAQVSFNKAIRCCLWSTLILW